ncbi:hypothetical protein [Streptomyces sp. NPDC087437]|uniref:hypothetical protein n=1 Tax=Streptomyces sp. NPDC087437 TaxID=3365789 RepID=UPI0037F76D9F
MVHLTRAGRDSPRARLTPNPRFRCHFSEDVGQSELLAGWIRRNLPGTAGRERARVHLTGEAASLVPLQVGRVRADLQERLTESLCQDL